MMGPEQRDPSAAPRHAALIRIDTFLYRVKIWTNREWAALPEEQRPGDAAPLLGLGWHVTEPVEMALWQAPGDLVEEFRGFPVVGLWPPGPLRRNPRAFPH